MTDIEFINELSNDWSQHLRRVSSIDPSNILAVALFGSRARGDSSPDSDIDLLMITPTRLRRHMSFEKVSLYMYPWFELKDAAIAGDLFVCHLVRESRTFFDPKNCMPRLRTLFRFKPTYESDARAASDLGWFIVRHGLLLDQPVVTRRIAWCVRTLLIARSAESGNPIFSANELTASAGFPAAGDLISQKASPSLEPNSLETLAEFLMRLGAPDPKPGYQSHKCYLAHFRSTANEVALRTIGRGNFKLLY